MLPNVIGFHLLSIAFDRVLFGLLYTAYSRQDAQHAENNNPDWNNHLDKVENGPPVCYDPENSKTQKTKTHNDIQHNFVTPLH